MTILKTQKSYKELRDQYSKFFRENESPSFGNLLWQFIINEANATRDVVFTAVYRNNALELVMVEAFKNGYYPLNVRFKEDVSYDDGVDIAEELSEMLFGSAPRRTSDLVLMSMRQPETTA